MSTLIIPIDASQVPANERGKQRVKVAVQEGNKTRSQIVAVEAGKAEVKLEVDPKQPLSLAIGPENASDEDIFHLQTLTASVSPRQWPTQGTLSLPAFVLTPVWWRFWLFWCRNFDIEGRVVCADGSPVPGAEVRAFDVDFFWWWTSIGQVGPTAITDANGHFSIKFRWCCGWLPWWWWRLRYWQLEPLLVEKIYPVLKLNPALKFAEPTPNPTLNILRATATPSPAPAGQNPVAPHPAALPLAAPSLVATRGIDPSVIPGLRTKLLTQLPPVPELERLRIWPWFPWTPWLDCSPDIIFRVTQACGTGPAKVIVSENVFQTRWDIPTSLNVTLVANEEACCIRNPPPPPPGDCVLFTEVCQIAVPAIGGNSGAPATPVGYENPGGRDRPFAELISLFAQFGSSAQADYYELETKPQGAPPAAWAPVNPAGLENFSRLYFDAATPPHWFGPSFPVATSVPHVYESRHHYETVTNPGPWGTPAGRSWIGDPDEVALIQTSSVFADDAHDFRIVGYKALAGGGPDPATRKVLDGCGNNPQNNNLVVRLDNRIVLPPTPDNVHINTTEPDCGITSVSLGGVAVAACGAQQLLHGTPFEVDFFCTDPDGHLDHYELVVKYDVGAFKNLLSTADVGTLTLSVVGPGQAGPDYADALTQGAARPQWKGGSMKLVIDDASKVFPKTCCYVIELTVYKRNIVNCSGSLPYFNQTHYSFTVLV